MAVYFIAERENVNGDVCVKIGFSGEPKDRIKKLQTGCPYELQLMGWIETSDHKRTEKKLHDKFNHSHLRGEWFKLNSEIVLEELKSHRESGFIATNENVFEFLGRDKDGIPEFVGTWEWLELEIEECCPFCGCLAGMHYKDSIDMYHCQHCQELTNFSVYEEDL